MSQSNGLTLVKSGLMTLAACSISAAEPEKVAQERDKSMVTLVQEGGPRAVVIVPEETPKAAAGPVAGALELAEYLEKMTARAIPVVVEGKGCYAKDGQVQVDDDKNKGVYLIKKGIKFTPFSKDQTPPQGDPEIHVGWTSAAEKAVDRKRVEALDVDGFLIKSAPGRVHVVGKTPRGTYYGCVFVLEKYCGVRWYMPGEIGEDVPRLATVAIPEGERTVEPDFKHRELSGYTYWKTVSIPEAYTKEGYFTEEYKPRGEKDMADVSLWGKRNHLFNRINYHHNLLNVFDVKKYGKLYPDLYPVPKGKTERFIPDPKWPNYQPCLTHPTAVDLAMDYAREFFAKNPDAGSISLALNDGGIDTHCFCENCMKTVDLDLPPNKQRARQYFTFLNAVAERFDKEFPDKQIGHLLYGAASRYPDNMKIHPRLVTFPVRQSYRKYLPAQWKEVQDEMTLISQYTKEFGIYDWLHGSSCFVSRAQPRLFDSYIKEVYAKGCRYYKGEAYSNWGVDGFRYWLIAQLLWDSKQNVEDLLNDFYSRFFRESAEPMRVFFDTAEDGLRKAIQADLAGGMDEKDVTGKYFRYGAGQFEALPPDAIEKCGKVLAEAMGKAQSQIVFDRVDFFRRAYGVTRILAKEYHASKRIVELCKNPQTIPEGAGLFAEFTKPDMNVQLYYNTAILPDPCVVRPGDALFEPFDLALIALVEPIRDRTIKDLSKKVAAPVTAKDIDTAVQQAVWDCLSNTKGVDDRESLRAALVDAAGKIILCEPVATPPVVDGGLSDPCWSMVPVYGGFAPRDKRPVKYGTSFRMVYHGNRLYVAVDCKRPPGGVVATTTRRDMSVNHDDGVELFLNKLEDTDASQRFQVIINTNGNMLDFYDGKMEWDGDIKAAAKVEPDRYTMEFSVPLDQIGVDPLKTPFVRCNVVRNDLSSKGPRSDSIHPCWAPTARAFPDVKSRGLLLFNK